MLGTRPTKIQQPNDPTQKIIELKKRRRRKGVNTCVPTRWVHVQSKKKEEARVLKYFQVENGVMSFM